MLADRKNQKKRIAVRRALEWRGFRDQFYLKQSDLAGLLGITTRTVCAVETAESITPRAHILRRFHDLRVKYERRRQREAAVLSREPAKIESVAALCHYGKTPERLERLMSA